MTNTRRNHKFIRTRCGTYCAVQNHVIKIFQSGCKNLHSTNPSLQFAKPDRFVCFLTSDRRGPMLGPPEIQGPRSARTSDSWSEQREELDRREWKDCDQVQASRGAGPSTAHGEEEEQRQNPEVPSQEDQECSAEDRGGKLTIRRGRQEVQTSGLSQARRR